MGINAKEVLDDGGILDIRAVITFKGKVRNISHKVEEKEEVVMGEAVGLDLYSSFQQQEFTDFEIVCEDRNLQCHKVVLAARSPVFRAMLLNDMEESTRARVEPKEFNSQTMSMLLKFLYTGSIEQELLDKNAEAVFKAADYYEVTGLKKICEKKRQWKERLKESGHLVFEILEAVI